MMMRNFLFIALSLVLAANVSVQAKAVDPDNDPRFQPYRSGPELSRDDVLHNLNKRRTTIENMLETTKTKLRNHKAGIEKVDTKEYQALERRVEVLEKKLVQMDNVDEREIERHQQREQRRWERRSQRQRELHNEL